MKRMLLCAIRAYWHIPARHRRTCLFAESCSHHVYAAIETHGVIAGLRALTMRMRCCRPGYTLRFDGDRSEVVCVDGTAVPWPLVSAEIRKIRRPDLGSPAHFLQSRTP